MLICLFGAPLETRAGFWMQLMGNSFSIVEQRGATSTEQNRTLASTTVGYRFSQGFILGAQSLHAGGTTTSWAVGPKGGLFIKGLEVTAAYLPFAHDSADYSGGNVEITRFLHFGIYGTYWSTTYSERSDAEVFPRPVVKSLSPQLALGFHF
jgi:hypothetical protein